MSGSIMSRVASRSFLRKAKFVAPRTIAQSCAGILSSRQFPRSSIASIQCKSFGGSSLQKRMMSGKSDDKVLKMGDDIEIGTKEAREDNKVSAPFSLP
jgi:hypothetical protein